MNKLTTWREHDYFKEREDHYFLVSTLSPMLKVCKIFYDRGYWFDAGYGHIKATTARCVSLTDLKGINVYYKNYPKVKGIIGGYGIVKTPFIYVFWGQVPMRDNLYNFSHMTPNAGKPLGFPCALPDNSNVMLEP